MLDYMALVVSYFSCGSLRMCLVGQYLRNERTDLSFRKLGALTFSCEPGLGLFGGREQADPRGLLIGQFQQSNECSGLERPWMSCCCGKIPCPASKQVIDKSVHLGF